MDANKGKSLQDLAGIVVKKYGRDPEMLSRLVDFNVSETRGITGEERQVLSLPSHQRAAYIAARLKGLDATLQRQMIENFATKRILTESVAKELAPMLTP